MKKGNYRISAVKDGFISSGIKRIELKNDKKIVMEMGKEIDEVITADKKIITNGLYELDLRGISEQEFSELLETRVRLKLSDKNTVIPVESDDIAGSIVSLSFTREGQDSDITFKIKIKGPCDIENYGLMLIDADKDNIKTLSDIEYDGESVISNLNIKSNEEVILVVYDRSENDIKENPGLGDAKKLIEDIREHGIYLNEAGRNQEDILRNNFNNSLSPYVVAISMRLEKMVSAIGLFENWLMHIGPGKYELDIKKLDYILEQEEELKNYYPPDYDDYFEEHEEFLKENNLNEEEYYYDNYYWQQVKGCNSKEHYILKENKFLISYTPYEDKLCCDYSIGEYDVKLEVKKADQDHEEIREGEEEGIKIKKKIRYYYLTDFEIQFKMTSSADSELEWSFDFSWLPAKGAKTKEFVQVETKEKTDYVEDENGEYIEVPYRKIDNRYLYYPEKAILDVNGVMTDNKTYFDDENNQMPSVGKIILDGKLDFFADNENLITFEGRLDTEEFDYDGYLEIDFREKRSLQDMYDNLTLAQLNSCYISGRFTTGDYEIDGSCKMLFTYKDVLTNEKPMGTPLPEQIIFSGNYNNLSEENFAFNGDIKLTLDYSDYIVDFRGEAEGETEDNYLPYTIEIDAVLSQAEYADSHLNLQCERSAYREYQVDFTYRFPIEDEINESRYIAGTARIKDDINVRVYNQDNLLMEFTYNDADGRIGEIRNRNNAEEVFAEIYIENGDPLVRFTDGVTMRLLP